MFAPAKGKTCEEFVVLVEFIEVVVLE